MNLRDMIAALNSLLDEDGIRRPESVLIDTLNEGYFITAMLTQGCEISYSRRVIADSYVQTLPLDFFAATSIYVGTNRIWPIRLSDLDDLYANWVSESSGTSIYYSVVGAMTTQPQLWLFPRPSTTSTLKITYSAIPDRMVYDADSPQFPREHHYVLVRWAYAWELLKERGTLLANKAYQMYTKFIEDVNAFQQYVYRRTPDRDWVTPPLDAEAVRRKLTAMEALTPPAQGIEPQVLSQ